MASSLVVHRPVGPGDRESVAEPFDEVGVGDEAATTRQAIVATSDAEAV
jgi:hypothetical protein